jgi:hypothetical protein
LNIIDSVSSKWRKLGLLLDQTTNVLDGYDRMAMLDNNRCCEWVFNKWINNGGTKLYPMTWEGVYNVLCAIGHRATADVMKSALTDGAK